MSRININAVPVLSVFEKPDNSISFMLYASKLSFLRYVKQNNNLKQLLDFVPNLKLDPETSFDEKTDGDEITLIIDEIYFQNALENELILSSIRLFNLRMMNNTGKEQKHRRRVYHCLDLSDIIIQGIT